MARTDAGNSPFMGKDAERLRARMDRLGISDVELSRESGVDRGTISAIKRGQGFRRSTLARIENKLEELEHEAGLDAPPPDEEQVIEIQMQLPGEASATIVVRGPDAEERVANLLRRLRSDSET